MGREHFSRPGSGVHRPQDGEEMQPASLLSDSIQRQTRAAIFGVTRLSQ